jgi:uncharacterized protein with gpF-like domain
MSARDAAVRPFERDMFDAVRRVQKDLIEKYKRAIGSAIKADAGGLDLDDDDENEAQIAAAYRTTFPVIDRTFRAGGLGGLRKARVGLDFDMRSPAAERFLRERGQRFAQQVAETTWRELKRKLTREMERGTSIENLIDIVETVPAFNPARAEMIARTEVLGAYNGGLEEGFRQSGNVVSKVWLSALDDRTRETHLAMHDQTVPVGEDFESPDGGTTKAPGQFGIAAEDINCRCSMEAIVGVPGPEIEEVPFGVNETEVLD